MKFKSLPKVLVALFAACLLSCVFVACEKSDSLLSYTNEFAATRQNEESNVRASTKDNKYIDDESVKGEFEVRNGALHFKSSKIYFQTLIKFSKMKPEERLLASKSLGFKSLLDVQQDYINEIERAKSEKEVSLILSKYDDIVTVENGVARFHNIDMISAALINRKGLVYLGKSLRRYEGIEQTNIEDGDISILDDIQNPLVRKQIYILNFRNSSNNRMTNTCYRFYGQRSNGDNVQYNYPTGFTGNRAIDLEVVTIVDDWGSGTKVVTPYTIGYPLKKVFNKWYHYSTVNDLASFWECTVVDNVGWTRVSVADFSYSNDFGFIDYSGNLMLFLFNSSSFNTYFNFTYNGSTTYSSGGVSTPVTANCD